MKPGEDPGRLMRTDRILAQSMAAAEFLVQAPRAQGRKERKTHGPLLTMPQGRWQDLGRNGYMSIKAEQTPREPYLNGTPKHSRHPVGLFKQDSQLLVGT